MRIVVDSDVWVAGLRGSGDANSVLSLCISGRLQPLIGGALIAEYEDVMGRDNLWNTCHLSATERDELLEIFLSKCAWTKVYFAWRPNLSDDADNHIIELAVAGQANVIVTRNVRDLRSGELRFPGIRILTPRQLLQEFEL